MSRFPGDPLGGPILPGVNTAPAVAPNQPRVARFNLPSLGGGGGMQGMTLAALMQRQKELADAQSGNQMPPIQSWTQGAAHMSTIQGVGAGRVNNRSADTALQADIMNTPIQFWGHAGAIGLMQFSGIGDCVCGGRPSAVRRALGRHPAPRHQRRSGSNRRQPRKKVVGGAGTINTGQPLPAGWQAVSGLVRVPNLTFQVGQRAT
jgi:hypothetical protein